jgi:adenosylcobinamide-phosphate synthase
VKAGPAATNRTVRVADWPLAGGIVGGVLADALIGDPRRGHPVALFGQTATRIERRLYADSKARGAAFTACCEALAIAPVLAAARLLRQPPIAQMAWAGTVTWAVIGARSLTAEADRIQRALAAGDLTAARGLLPNLCGRDPAQLDEAGIARAVVESVAENCSDAVVAPLLWGALAGPPGLAAYRAANTLDAMVGHHSPRYERFGWASARLDDVANWAPARVTALLAAACAPVVGGSPSATWRIATEYGPRHPSPNAGWCEAAFAGALGVQLGGTLSYSGRIEHRPGLGAGRPPEPADIARATRLCRVATAAATALAASVALSATPLPSSRTELAAQKGPKRPGARQSRRT